MGAPAAAICDLADLEVALASPDAQPVSLVVDAPVPSWLAEAVARLRRVDRPLQVHLVGGDREGAERAGREIGMLVALFGAGVHPDEIHGVGSGRVRRVAEVMTRWDRHEPRGAAAHDAQAEANG